MAQVSFAHDDRPPIDAALEQCGTITLKLGKPLRCRFQPYLYDHPGGDYRAWSGLTWTLDLTDVEEGRRLREGLTHFFRVFGGGEKKQRRMLTELERMAVGVRG